MGSGNHRRAPRRLAGSASGRPVRRSGRRVRGDLDRGGGRQRNPADQRYVAGWPGRYTAGARRRGRHLPHHRRNPRDRGRPRAGGVHHHRRGRAACLHSGAPSHRREWRAAEPPTGPPTPGRWWQRHRPRGSGGHRADLRRVAAWSGGRARPATSAAGWPSPISRSGARPDPGGSSSPPMASPRRPATCRTTSGRRRRSRRRRGASRRRRWPRRWRPGWRWWCATRTATSSGASR